MDSNHITIQTTKIVYPQIYAYTLLDYSDRKNWVKIGYTRRKDVDVRIKEQTKTAAVNHKYVKLWAAPAKFNTTDTWFTDKQFHTYLRKNKGVQQDFPSEWFYYHGTPEKARSDFEDFINSRYEQTKDTLEYQLRAEQNEAVEKTLESIMSNPEGKFLWNAKPRFGKTLTTYDLVRKLNATKVLIVTNRPAIANSWFDDFETFIAWQTDFAFVSTSDSLNERPVMTRDEFLSQRATGRKNLIAFISLQDLKGAMAFGGTYNKLSWVKELTWDLLVIDESHEGVDTFKTDVAFENITKKFALHLSGTPFKAVAAGTFNDDSIYNWTYEDEQNAKANWNHPDENNPYEKMPQLNLFSYQMSQMITDKVNKGAQIEGENMDYAFDLNEFFETNNSGKFVHEADVSKWLDALSRNEKYPFSTKAWRSELKHTFWLLHRVASAKALQKLLQNHPVFENYDIILAAGDGRGHDQDAEQVTTDKSINRVKEAIKAHDKTITLSVGQLTTGITIPEWTAVLMLSNAKSPSLYMQAAFRAQNPWEYEIDGDIYQKQNAYVFDFAPERTLTIYEEFANNLSRKTVNGSGTSDDRTDNIKQLLNFFPVIAEDNEGKMVALDATQVLTIPKTIKAQEVVRRGFMSNLLFQNVSGIFASAEVQEILNQLNPVDQGKSVPRQQSESIDPQNIAVDDKGDVIVSEDIVIAETNARFGDKFYGDFQSSLAADATVDDSHLAKSIEADFKKNTAQVLKELAQDKGLSVKVAEQVAQASAQVLAREVEFTQTQAKIKQNEAEIVYKKVVEEAHHDADKVAEAAVNYKAVQAQIQSDYQQELAAKIETKRKELVQQSTQTILTKAEDKKKNIVEDDVRSRLRGFTRTIPSFLMAYGKCDTSLQNFDKHISDSVFKEVTGIELHQFRTLRDDHQLFNEIVFDESIFEFLKKRTQLANYFDDSQQEDIFDYIPPQQTNQIFTPKKVVKMMIDKLEEEDPDLFSDPNKTFADLYMKSGLYITEIVTRLYIGLESHIPDPDARLKHILENQVYGFAPTEIIYNIARNFVFGFDDRAQSINQSHIVHLDTTPYAKSESNFEIKCSTLFGEKK